MYIIGCWIAFIIVMYNAINNREEFIRFEIPLKMAITVSILCIACSWLFVVLSILTIISRLKRK